VLASFDRALAFVIKPLGDVRAMAMRSASSCIPRYLVIAVLALPLVDAVHFYLHAGEKRCFYDEEQPGAKVLGEYTVSAGPGSMPIHLDVRSANGAVLYFQQTNIEHGKFAFVVLPDEEHAPSVAHAEMHRQRQAEAHGAASAVDSRHAHSSGRSGVHPPEHRRGRLMSEPNAEPEPLLKDGPTPAGAGGDHVEWDLDKYGGIDEEALEAEARRVAESMGVHPHDRSSRDYGLTVGNEYDELGSSAPDSEIRRTFDIRRFQICVVSDGPHEPGLRRRIRLVVRKGSAAHDYHRLAKTEHMSTLEVSLGQISSELHDLLAQLELAHRMEEALRSMHFRTNRSVVIYAIVSILAVLVIGIVQARYTRGILKTKKLL
jgi:fumarate reductase subunit D